MFRFLFNLVSSKIRSMDKALKDVPASQIILATAILMFLYRHYQNPWIARAYRARHNKTAQQQLLDLVFERLKAIPQIKGLVHQEMIKSLQSAKEKLAAQRAHMSLQETMPEKGMPVAMILKEFNIDINACRFDFNSVHENHPARNLTAKKADGQDSGVLYTVRPQELKELLKEVYGETELENTMHEHKTPRLNAMLAEILNWFQHLFHGSKEGYGILTHGGSTSIIEAMAAYVLLARTKGIEHPEIVVPETAHAAFIKAAVLTGATLITVPVDKKTGAVTAKEMRKYISRNTAVLVGSAPSYMNGICDPIEDLGQLALEFGLPLHVDACLGGMILIWLNSHFKMHWDFRTPGVSSISADTHKFGFCPKGSSVCLFSANSPALPVYNALDWKGGLYVTPGILDGSTSGARVAEIYATLCYFGQQKYRITAEKIVTLRESLQRKIALLSGTNTKRDIYVYGDPQLFLLGFRSDTINPHLIADELDARGWKLNLLQNPPGFHFCLTEVHTVVEGFEEKFIADLQDSIQTVKAYPPDRKPSENVKVYGAVGMMPTSVQIEAGTQYQKARLFYQVADKTGSFTPAQFQA